jgi:DNA-binding response OmpR family regulator
MTEPPALDLTGCKILVTDDVPANLDVLFQALDGEGYNVHVASDGATALEVAAHSGPDLILLDVMMPGMDGYETCRRLKADRELKAIPVIFLTARDDLEGTVEGFGAGGEDYVTKPFKKEEVLARIRTHLERTLYARQLHELNEHLEQKVDERTRDLQLKVAELEGKDRIAQHLLTVHTLEETLGLVLQVLSDVLLVERAVVYLDTDGVLQAVADIGFDAVGAGQAVETDIAERIRKTMAPVRITDPESAMIPITGQGELLGIVQVFPRSTGQPLSDEDLHTLSSFSLQAAVAIRDSQMRQDPDTWKDQLAEVLEIEHEIEETGASRE